VGPHGWLSLNALWFWIDSAQSIFSNGSNTWLTGWRIVDVGCYGLKLWRIYSRSLSRKKNIPSHFHIQPFRHWSPLLPESYRYAIVMKWDSFSSAACTVVICLHGSFYRVTVNCFELASIGLCWMRFYSRPVFATCTCNRNASKSGHSIRARQRWRREVANNCSCALPLFWQDAYRRPIRVRV